MKSVPLREFSGLKTTEVIKGVIERPPRGATISSMRSGVRLLDAMEKNTDKENLILEDADHAALVSSINEFSFGLVSKDLLTILEDILNASAPA